MRYHMMKLAKSKGLNHPDTIKCSQELDEFLNKYQQIKSI
ncbi:aspartyl-phosphate phosphatase Spo0E family protein [Pseudomonas sp. 2822-17]